jgi:biopolymer transport protein ExbB/TolQ
VGSTSPYVGLLGTVWGIMNSFLGLSKMQTASIETVAPGIAEALITTIAGLLIAIPALMLFYYVSSKVKEIEYQLYLLSDRVVSVARNLVLDKDNSSTSIIQDELSQEIL